MDLIVKTGRLRAPKYLICAELIYICFQSRTEHQKDHTNFGHA